MSNWGVDVSGMNQMDKKLNVVEDGTVAATKQGTRQEAEEILREIKITAPVRTGAYRDDWEIDEDRGDDDEIVIVNTVDYAVYLVFPNTHMVGSNKADDPARGILHNVRGIVAKKEPGILQGVASSVRSFLGGV